MITEDYVSFETAKLLKEKGFDGNCFYVWVNADNQTPSLLATANFVEGEMATNRETLDIVTQYHMNTYEANNKIESFLCPTLQMTCKWLRKVHNLHIWVDYSSFDFDDKLPYLWNIRQTKIEGDYWGGTYHKSYEEACEEAIKYCLENLI